MFNITQAGIEILIIAVVLAIVSNLVTKLTVGKEVLANKEKTKQLQKELKEAIKRNDLKRAKEIQKEMLNTMSVSMSATLKPMLITIIPFFLVFIWMMEHYGNIGAVEYEISIYNLSNADAFLEDPVTQNGSSKLTGILKAGETKNFRLHVTLNTYQANETIVKIKANAKCINHDCKYTSYAEAHLSTKEELKMAPNEEKDIVDISPKYNPKKSESGVGIFDFKLKNYLSDECVRLFGISLNWFWWYLIAVIIVSFSVGKILKTY